MEIDAIVVKDLGRGVVTDALITILSNECNNKKDKNIPWFVSTKIWKPEWLKKNINLKLLLIPQVAAQSAIDRDDVNVWITNGKRASQKALTAIESLYADYGHHSETMFIVLPDKLNALAVDFRNNDVGDAVFMVIKDKFENLGLDTNMASVFLGAATGLYLKHNKINPENDLEKSREENFKKIVCGSIKYTHDWQVHEIKRITEHETWEPSKSPEGYLDDQYEAKNVEDVEIIAFKHAKNEWAQAVSGLGIVTDHNEKEKFELWRGMVDVDGYVCIADSKQKSITRLVHAINEYSKNFNKSGMRGGRARVQQASCLLFASPGAGKTSLVRQLAENNNLLFMPFNITEMNRTTDIIDCFDNIMTTSLLDPTKPLLIFIDEINSELENDYVYKMFLSPLEDGKYNREGKSFRLPSCFWVFASTESGDIIRSKMKGSDFVSRLTAGTISLDIQDKGARQIENIYMAVSIMLSIFPDVNRISREVLEIFSDKLVNARIRELRHFIEKFVDVQYGTVSLKNIPNQSSDNISFSSSDREPRAQRESERIEALKSAKKKAKSELANLNNEKETAQNANPQDKNEIRKLDEQIEKQTKILADDGWIPIHRSA